MSEQAPEQNEPEENPPQPQGDKPVWLYYLIMLIIVAVPLILVVWYALSKFDAPLEQYIAQYVLTSMSDADKEKLYATLAKESPGLFEAIPEPLVGRVLQKNTTKEHKRAEVITNNAGMRSKFPYTRKREDKYRIVCLGDSVVFGTGGKEEDRFGNQIEEILGELGVTVDGKEVEVYSVGVPSWTTLNESAYLTSRISEYAPDLVLALTIRNDISDGEGVLGAGHATARFSPQQRRLGSGVFHYHWPRVFGTASLNLLRYDLGPESRRMWTKTFDGWKRLEALLEKSDAKMALGVMASDPLYLELNKYFQEAKGLKSPIVPISFMGNSLPHDSHPNRKGHRMIALLYLYAMADLGWLPVKVEDLARLEPKIKPKPDTALDIEKIRALKDEMVEKFLDENIVFNRLDEANTISFLGGIYPGNHKETLSDYPFGSTRSGFLLKRRHEAKHVILEIEAPSRVEIYPFKLEMRLNGAVAAELTLDEISGAGRHTLRGVIPESKEFGSTVEVVLRTDSYWTTIDDPTMKSYRLISVRQE